MPAVGLPFNNLHIDFNPTGIYLFSMSTIRLSTEDAIIEAAFEVLNADPSASLSDIAESAGVGRATLHRHFPKRDELIKALALIAIQEMDLAVTKATKDAKSYKQAFEAMFAVLVPLGDRHGFLTNDHFNGDIHIKDEIEKQSAEMIEMMEALKVEGVFSKDLPTGWIIQATNYLLYAAWNSVKQGDFTQAQAVELSLQTFFRGLGNARS